MKCSFDYETDVFKVFSNNFGNEVFVSKTTTLVYRFDKGLLKMVLTNLKIG